jgi:hypothetical protein
MKQSGLRSVPRSNYRRSRRRLPDVIGTVLERVANADIVTARDLGFRALRSSLLGREGTLALVGTCRARGLS